MLRAYSINTTEDGGNDHYGPLVRFVLESGSRGAVTRNTREALEPTLARNNVVATTKGREDPWQ
jgi:hypothetical protein